MEKKYAKLRGRIIEKCGTVKSFSDKMKKTPTTIGSKLNGKSIWKDKEINLACEILDIPKCEAHYYFLT